MNRDVFKGKWKEMKGQIKQKWGKLTDNDLTEINGDLEELEGKLQKHYGYEKEKIKTEIDDFFNTNKSEKV